MALTKIGTDGFKDDAVTTDKLANAINTERTANTAKVSLTDNSVTLAKMAGGTDGQIITYDASGDPVAVGPGTDGQVLTSTGAGSPPAFEDASGTTINNNADNRVITGSGTANTLEGEANVTYNGTRLEVKTGDLAVTGAEGGDAQLRLTADEGDDGADYWRLESKASDNNFNLATYASGSWVDKVTVDSSGNATLNSGSLILSTAGQGIEFHPSGASNVNLLDDYEEGTWTPIVKFDGAWNNQSYAYQAGTYTKIGRQVFFSCYFQFSNKGTSSGNARLYGLPFTAANIAHNYTVCSVWMNSGNLGEHTPTGYVQPDSTYFNLQRQKATSSGGDVSTWDESNFTNSSDIMVSGHYTA